MSQQQSEELQKKLLAPWHEVYLHRMGDGYYKYFTDRYLPFLKEVYDLLKNDVPSDGLVAEIGCGMGNTTRFINELNCENPLMLIDNSAEMLMMAMLNVGENSSAVYHYNDLMKAIENNYAMIHSHGVLEHFSDEDIEKIINCNTEIQIHYVPTDKYDEPSRGDERLLSVEKWVELTKPTRIMTFNDGKDLIIIKTPWN